MVLYSQCDTGRDIGLLRAYMASDFRSLRDIANRKAVRRGEKLKRKADFFLVLAKMAQRLDGMPNLKEIGI